MQIALRYSNLALLILIAIYITLAKRIGFGHIETDWGLYFLTACILNSLAIASLTNKP